MRQFPAAWEWLVDEAVPGWVKKTYSPRESWRDKPFTKEDARFFSKGVRELSELFTTDRPRAVPAYFRHPRFRSAYLLYFVPLQAAKFLAVLDAHPEAFEAALAHGRERGKLRIADLGAGPGTASLAVLLALLDKPAAQIPPAIELDWLDTDGSIMADGRGLVEMLASQFPKLRGRVTLRTHVAPWWELPRVLARKDDGPAPLSLTLVGHVLNESRAPALERAIDAVTAASGGGGTLFVEPAARGPSQQLSRMRDALASEDSEKPFTLWGPCLHAGACPLAEGRDWCHQSVRAEVPGKWFRELTRQLGTSSRQWLKYSYVWLASHERPAPPATPGLRRVVSDAIAGGRGGESEVLLCEPGKPRRMAVNPRKTPFRGDLITVVAPRQPRK